MNWFGYSLLALGCFTFFNLLNRVVAANSQHPRAGAFAFNIWGGLAVIILFLFTSKTPAIEPSSLPPFIIILIIVSVLLYAGYERLQFSVKKHIDASTTSILFRLSPAFTFIFSLAFLREELTLNKLLGAALIWGGNLLTAWKGKVLKVNNFFWLGVLCTLFLGIAWTIDKRVSSEINSALYTLLLWLGPIPFIYLPHLPLQTIKKEFILGSWKSPLMAILNVVGFYFQIVALSKADATKVIPIISSSSLLVVLLAMWLLKESAHRGKKIFAAVLATLGVILLK